MKMKQAAYDKENDKETDEIDQLKNEN